MTDTTNDIKLYLAALNHALAVGLRSRARILVEVGEHLQQAADDVHAELLVEAERHTPATAPAEELWVTAQRRAIAPFGSPEEVAAGFEGGRLEALDKRLALIDASMERWVGRRPLLGGTIWAAVTSLMFVAMGLAIVGVGALFGVGYFTNVMMTMGFASALAFVIRITYVLRGDFSAGGVWARCGIGFDSRMPVAFRDFVPLMFFMGYMMLTDPMSFTLSLLNWLTLVLVVELAVRLARRKGHSGGWSAYDRDDPDANWSRYLTGLWTATAITLALMVIGSGVTGLVGALGLLLLAVTGMTVFVRRLALNSAVKRNWEKMYGGSAAAAG
jgi:hypothetical protein